MRCCNELFVVFVDGRLTRSIDNACPDNDDLEF